MTAFNGLNRINTPIARRMIIEIRIKRLYKRHLKLIWPKMTPTCYLNFRELEGIKRCLLIFVAL